MWCTILNPSAWQWTYVNVGFQFLQFYISYQPLRIHPVRDHTCGICSYFFHKTRREIPFEKMSAQVRNSFTQRRKQRKNEKRSLLVYLTMLVSFMFGWFPYFFLTLLMDIDYSFVKDIPYWINVTFLFMRISSSLIDPLLFTFFEADFQKALRNAAHGSLKAFRVTSTNSTRTTRKTAEF